MYAKATAPAPQATGALIDHTLNNHHAIPGMTLPPCKAAIVDPAGIDQPQDDHGQARNPARAAGQHPASRTDR